MKKINLKYLPSDLGNVSPKRISGRVPFGNKKRRFTDNIILLICIYIL